MNLLKKKKFLVLKYVKLSIKHGKKQNKEQLLKLAFAYIKNITKQNPLIILLDAIQKAKPFCEIKSFKIKGSVQRIPIGIKEKRQKNLALNWLLLNSLKRNEKTIMECLAKELLETISLESKTIKMWEDVHKIVETNKTFTQFKN